MYFVSEVHTQPNISSKEQLPVELLSFVINVRAYQYFKPAEKAR
jgi:hypothetical protein